MKTEFTPEELYQAYSVEVGKELVQCHGMSRMQAERLLVESGFRRLFMSDPSLYDFCSPGEVADELLYTPKPARAFVFRRRGNAEGGGKPSCRGDCCS